MVLGIRLEHFLGASFWRFSGHDPLGGEPAADPELAGGTRYLIWPGIPREELEELLGKVDVWINRMKMDGWMETLKLGSG